MRVSWSDWTGWPTIGLVTACVFTFAACGDGPTEPTVGEVRMTVVTTGDDIDMTGYELRIGSAVVAARVNDVVSRELPTGPVEVELRGIASNCVLDGTKKRSVTVTSGASVDLEFRVVCARTDKIAYTALDDRRRQRTAVGIVGGDGSEAIMLHGDGISPTWSPDGKRLTVSTAWCDWYYVVCGGGLVLAELETGTTSIITNGMSGFEPAWSPDGEWIAFIKIATFDEPGRLHVTRLDGSPAVEISLPAVRSAGHPAWSPDSRRIAFSCLAPGAATRWAVCVVNRDGSGFAQLTNGVANEVNPAWSPDASTIAFTTTRFSGATDIAVMTASGGEVVRVTAGSDPAWSPDGKRIVFASNSPQGLFTVRPDGTELTQITRGAHHAPAWRP